jgi:small subunit ribosomal protein S21|tara:strand:- start:518 stop:727 length:210 start_codon:yes stop_codon:yes gene_type:complete
MSKTVNVSIKPLRKDSPERMIRRFTRKVKKLGILDEVKKRRYYKKPSEVRREKAIRRKRETAKLERKKK